MHSRGHTVAPCQTETKIFVVFGAFYKKNVRKAMLSSLTKECQHPRWACVRVSSMFLRNAAELLSDSNQKECLLCLSFVATSATVLALAYGTILFRSCGASEFTKSLFLLIILSRAVFELESPGPFTFSPGQWQASHSQAWDNSSWLASVRMPFWTGC